MRIREDHKLTRPAFNVVRLLEFDRMNQYLCPRRLHRLHGIRSTSGVHFLQACGRIARRQGLLKVSLLDLFRLCPRNASSTVDDGKSLKAQRFSASFQKGNVSRYHNCFFPSRGARISKHLPVPELLTALHIPIRDADGCPTKGHPRAVLPSVHWGKILSTGFSILFLQVQLLPEEPEIIISVIMHCFFFELLWLQKGMVSLVFDRCLHHRVVNQVSGTWSLICHDIRCMRHFFKCVMNLSCRSFTSLSIATSKCGSNGQSNVMYVAKNRKFISGGTTSTSVPLIPYSRAEILTRKYIGD
jgi:hypothetical protein